LCADCTKNDVLLSNNLYFKANRVNSPKKQIDLLEKALEVCYAPQIEASLLATKISTTSDKNLKIQYYKRLIGVVVQYKDKK